MLNISAFGLTQRTNTMHIHLYIGIDFILKEMCTLLIFDFELKQQHTTYIYVEYTRVMPP